MRPVRQNHAFGATSTLSKKIAQLRNEALAKLNFI